MDLINQSVKVDMEECKVRARAAGLVFPDNTLEYIVSNDDLIEMSPKVMVPTLYDYWVHDIQVLRGKWEYDASPHNPYETVINTRPPISFYLSENAHWFNVMIFYHVLGHIDFFQNNVFFRRTWDDDFSGQALADKRLINSIRQELGENKRWVDYVIEFALAIDNLVGYHKDLEETDRRDAPMLFVGRSEKLDFYFGQFLRQAHEQGRIELKFYHDELARYNQFVKKVGEAQAEIAFFEDNFLRSKFPEFNAIFRKWKDKEHKPTPKDLLEYLMQNSAFLKREENEWMSDVIQVIRRTSLYFQPQIRTKIANEGWASFCHQKLFIPDERMSGHEIDFARVDSGVTADRFMGFNPYAVGMHLFQFIEEMARRGKLSPEYQLVQNIEARKHFDQHRGDAYAREAVLAARRYFDDYLLLNFLSPPDFQDFVDKHKYWVLGIRPSRTEWNMADVYVKSRNGEDFRKLLNQSLYHPPHVVVDERKAQDGELYLNHFYEGRELHAEFIPEVLMGLEFLWGKRVRLETTIYEEVHPGNWWEWQRMREHGFEHRRHRVVYTCEGKRITRTMISTP